MKNLHYYYYDCLNSTNIEAWQLLKNGLKPPFVVVAKQQTGGKGQRGNQWESLVGGLYFTVMLPEYSLLESSRHLTLLTAVVMVRALEKYHLPVKIKWLNDLILNHKKLGGILVETKINKGQIRYILVGVGINVFNPVNDFAISIKQYFQEINQDYSWLLKNLLSIIVDDFFECLYFYKIKGIKPIVEVYNQYLAYPQKEVFFAENKGTVEGADTEGNLIVKFSGLNSSSRVKFPPHSYRISSLDSKKIPQIKEVNDDLFLNQK